MLLKIEKIYKRRVPMYNKLREINIQNYQNMTFGYGKFENKFLKNSTNKLHCGNKN